MPLPLPLKYKRFKNTCPLFFLSPALPRGVKNLKALVDPLHLPRVLDLRTRRFADDIRLQFQLFQRYGERIKFGAVNGVLESEVLHLALCGIHDLGKMRVKMFHAFEAEFVDHVGKAGEIVVRRF